MIDSSQRRGSGVLVVRSFLTWNTAVCFALNH